MNLKQECLDFGETYYCKHCNCNVAPKKDLRGRNKVRAFRTGFVALFLECGHCCPVGQEK